jgi:protein gp37
MGWPWKVTLHPARLDEPLKWRKPQVASVAFMGDLWHEAVPDLFILEVWLVMAMAPEHRFLVLTKRPKRMHDLLSSNFIPSSRYGVFAPDLWPLPNVWLGVSVEDQATADERIPLLLETPAAHRWASIEPELEAVDLSPWLNVHKFTDGGYGPLLTVRHALCGDGLLTEGRHHSDLDWVVVGGESGPRHRPCDPAWIQSIADQCDAAGLPCYIKQASHRYPGRQGDIADALWARKAVPW